MTRREQEFVAAVWEYFTDHRRDLPWRNTTDPYRILVSEVMLQQTQASRVVEKYREFLRAFPSISALAAAPLSLVLRTWQGLGYNRRAKMLHECAKEIKERYRGRFPRTYTELLSLPGVGPYTAGAVLAFAFNTAVPIIETNIRTAYLYHFFKGKTGVSDKDIRRIVLRTMDIERPREWYAALMDYGAYIKQAEGNNAVQSRHYTKQSPFTGSDREIRGAILRALSDGADVASLPFNAKRLERQLEALQKEGLVAKRGGGYVLPS